MLNNVNVFILNGERYRGCLGVIRTMAWTLFFAVVLEQVGFSAESFRTNYPKDNWVLQEEVEGRNGRLVILIQDAHTNTGGQKNLAAGLDYFLKAKNIPLIFVEGSSQDVSLTACRTKLPLNLWRRVARRFLSDGVLSGEEYLNLTTEYPMTLSGMEHRSLYDRNLRAYADIASTRQKALSYLEKSKAALGRLKRRFYPKALINFESDEDHFEKRIRLAKWIGLSLERDFPETWRLMVGSSKEAIRPNRLLEDQALLDKKIVEHLLFSEEISLGK